MMEMRLLYFHLFLEASSRLIDKDEGAGVKQEDRHEVWSIRDNDSTRNLFPTFWSGKIA